jgi:hypothetical protein
MNTICHRTGELCPAAGHINGISRDIDTTREQQIEQAVLAMQENAEMRPTRRQSYEEKDFAELDRSQNKLTAEASALVLRCGVKARGLFARKALDCVEVAELLESRAQGLRQQ